MFGVVFRRLLMAVVIGVFLHILYLAVGSNMGADKEFADTLPWVIVIILMIPTDRLTTAGLQNLLNIWKGRPGDDSKGIS